ncbi:hypothetical protein [Paenibacillus andongensis]|uniref:hypothetical protein n=1 Tax=Paenibacillus andongensis TaxID=2975482 RepID=UPI0021BA5FA5|nr:hypothetical protein [Paenibacillus andongensis]
MKRKNRMIRQFEGFSFIGLWIIGFTAFALGTGVAVAVLWMWVLQPDFGILNYFLSFVGLGHAFPLCSTAGSGTGGYL